MARLLRHDLSLAAVVSGNLAQSIELGDQLLELSRTRLAADI